MDIPLFDNSSLAPELDTRVRSELRDNEQLLWVGQPRPGRCARQALPIVLFGIPWTAFALFWMVAASGMLFGGGGGLGAIGIIFPLFGLPFVLIGLAMLSSPYWLRKRAKRTCYALTNRRAIVWKASWFGSVEVRSYGPNELTKLRRVEYPNGEGDIVFEETTVTFGRDADGNRTAQTNRNGFMAIENVRAIEELLRKALQPIEGDATP
ncbi:MAG: hypothetical protein K8T89_06060 [Planctomycetes bacterium]|nr:hypothetical protein [Planctomycetota bacterium]